MKAKRILMLAGLGVLLCACATTGTSNEVNPLKPRTLGKGAFGGYQEPTRLVITNQASWNEVWVKHTVNEFPKKSAPQVDFSRETVLFTSMGRKNTGGYSISIESVERRGNELVAKVTTKSPVPGGFSIQALSAPYHIVAVESTGAPVRFEIAEAKPQQGTGGPDPGRNLKD